MVIYVDKEKLKDFEIDSKMNVVVSPNFKNNLSSMAEKLFKIIAGFCLYAKTYEMEGANFNALLDNNYIDFDRKVVEALLELKQEKYIEVSL